MCACPSGCSVAARKYCVFGCGTFSLLLAVALALLWPPLFLHLLHSQLELRPGSTVYDNWIETPLPMYIEFHMFNWTNPEHARDPNVRPAFVECGPYVFREHHRRVALDWHSANGSVSYNQTRVWHFVPELSNGSLSDRITQLNVVAASAAYTARDFNTVLRRGLNLVLKMLNTQLYGTHPVGELLFDGYRDRLLDFINQAKVPGVNVPFDRFGWFYARNNSASYDGRMNIFTGADPADGQRADEGPAIERTGNVHTWNGEQRTRYYRADCGRVQGSAGELWHPNVRLNEPLEIFATDVCKRLPLAYAGRTEVLGVSGGQWIGDDRMLDNGMKYPDMRCTCTADSAHCPDLLPGVLNVSECRFGAPAFVSYPHFYLADESYRRAVDGMRPDAGRHEFRLALEPMTGIPLEVNARLQINILLQPIRDIDVFQGVPQVMLPMFWFTQRAALTEEFAKQAKLALMAPCLGVYTAYGIGMMAVILLLIGAILQCTNSWGTHSQFLNDRDIDDELRQ